MELVVDRQDPWDGPNRVFADRLLAHCLVTRIDPPHVTFRRAVRLLVVLDNCTRTATVTPVENRVERDRALCTCALRLAELVL